MSTKNYYQNLNDNNTDVTGSNLVIGGVNFGSRWSDYDAAALQHLQLEASTQQQLQMIEDERNYNSPAEQAKRMRAAGLNPNLVGLEGAQHNQSISAGVGSSSGASTAQNLSAVSSFVGNMVNLLPQAISIVQSLKSNSLDNMIKEADLHNLARGEAVNLIGQQATLEDLKDKTSLPYVSSNGIVNRRYRKLVQKNIDYFLNDASNRDVAIGAVYKRKGNSASDRVDYLNKAGVSSYSDSDSSFIECLKELFDFEQQFKKSQYKFDTQYNNARNPKQMAQDEAIIRSSEASLRSTDSNRIDKEWNRKISELWNSGDKGDQWKAGILYILTRLSGSISVGPKGKTKSIGF